MSLPLTHQVRKAPSLFPSLANGLHTLTQAQRCTATRHVDTDTHALPAQTLGLRQKYSQAPGTVHSQTLYWTSALTHALCHIPLTRLAPPHDPHLLSPLAHHTHLSRGPHLAEN